MLDYSLLVGIHRLPPHLSQSERDARIAQLEQHGGFVSLERQKVYFFGIIDVLERYNLRWQIQRLVLTFGYHVLCRAPAALGISALTPPDYAERFRTFALVEALQLPRRSPSSAASFTPRARSPSFTADAAALPRWPTRSLPASPQLSTEAEERKIRACLQQARAAADARRAEAGTLSANATRTGQTGNGANIAAGGRAGTVAMDPFELNYERWGHLWQRRRRGLVKMRIEGDRADHLRRIEELEAEVRRLSSPQATGDATVPSAGRE